MDVSEAQELFIIVPAVLISIFLLVVIDRIGIIRSNVDEEEEE